MKDLAPPLPVLPQLTKKLTAAELLSLITSNLEETFLLVGLDLSIVFFSESTRIKAKEHLGVDVQPGMSILELTPPDNRKNLSKIYQKVFRGEKQTTEVVLTDATGQTTYIENAFKPLHNAAGEIVGAMVSAVNITEKKIAEIEKQKASEKLLLSEQQYKNLFQLKPHPCYIYNKHTLQILEVNEAAVATYGYTAEEFLQLTVEDLQVEENREKRRKILQNNINTFKFAVDNWKHKTKSGKEIFVDLRVNAIKYNNIDALLVVSQDVTYKVQAAEALKRSHERFTLAAKATTEALWEWNFITSEAYISQAYTDIMGWPSADFRKFDEWEDYLHPDDKAAAVKKYNEAIYNPKAEKWEHEYRYLKSDGTYVYVQDRAFILRDEEGKPVKVIGALKDIHEQKIAAEKLKESNERFVLASRAASDAIYDWNLLTNELHWGEGISILFGYQPNDITIETWIQNIHQQYQSAVEASLNEAFARPEVTFWKYEYLFKKANGAFCTVFDRGYIVRDENGNPTRLIGSMQDISERKYNEQILSLERATFERSANPNIKLEQVLETLLTGWETLHPGAVTSVLLVRDAKTVDCVVSPGLPEAFKDALRNLPIEANACSCGTALHTRHRIIVPDIQTSPLWQSYRCLADAYQLRACWSLPVTHSFGHALGTLAIYFRQPKAPTPFELASAERLQNITRIVVENRYTLQEIKITNERFDVMMQATNDVIWDWDLKTGMVYRDPIKVRKVYGIESNASIQTIEDWMQRIHPDERPGVDKALSHVLKSKTENNFVLEYRFQKADGTWIDVYNRGAIVRDANGEPVRAIGATQDITQRKLMEKELLSNELEHQKAINKATVDTQENERSEIGRELHDNVNQVLTTTKLYIDLAKTRPEMREELLRKSSENLINVINEIRQLSRSLMDPSIGDLGLIDSILDLIENINLTGRITVNLQAENLVEDLLDANQKLAVFRIVQEALNNALKHSKAKKVLITLKRRSDIAEMTITDDGIGFNIETVKKGAGLKNIQNRIYLVNGTHTITTQPGCGVKMKLQFPITQTNIAYTN